MRKVYPYIVVFLLLIVSSCIPNKDLIYLQNNNSKNANNTIQPVVLKPYRVQINDVLSIKIKALDQRLVDIFSPSTQQGGGAAISAESLYFEGFVVDDHGTVRVPTLGEVAVIGLTLDEIRIKIEKQLLEQYFTKEADLFVTVKLGGMRYTVNGEIAIPGTKTLFQDKVTILEAIANCGDITITGNRKEVMVVRQYPYGTEIHSIDLTNIDVMQSPFYYIQPNDYIYIKPLKQKSWGTGTTGLQSFTTILTTASLLLTTFLLFNRN